MFWPVPPIPSTFHVSKKHEGSIFLNVSSLMSTLSSSQFTPNSPMSQPFSISLSSLPTELISHIVSYLDGSTLLNLKITSTLFKEIVVEEIEKRKKKAPPPPLQYKLPWSLSLAPLFGFFFFIVFLVFVGLNLEGLLKPTWITGIPFAFSLLSPLLLGWIHLLVHSSFEKDDFTLFYWFSVFILLQLICLFLHLAIPESFWTSTFIPLFWVEGAWLLTCLLGPICSPTKRECFKMLFVFIISLYLCLPTVLLPLKLDKFLVFPSFLYLVWIFPLSLGELFAGFNFLAKSRIVGRRRNCARITLSKITLIFSVISLQIFGVVLSLLEGKKAPWLIIMPLALSCIFVMLGWVALPKTFYIQNETKEKPKQDTNINNEQTPLLPPLP